MLFDFQQYLAKVDPYQPYIISRLTGGFVNETVRVTRDPGRNTLPSVFGLPSLILKHAPPYVAGRGPGAPMSQSRQVTEAHALALLDTIDCLKENDVKLPHLLRHDPELHVMIITDLGDLPSLSQAFSPLGGYRQHETPSNWLDTTNMTGPALRARFTEIGAKVGTFLAALHSSHTIDAIKHSPNTIVKYDPNSELRASWFNIAIKSVRSQIALFPEIVSPESEKLYHLIEEDFLRPLPQAEQSFVLGDCWTASILFDLTGTMDRETEVGIVDWEFASIGRGPHGDLAQLLAHLELFRIAAVHGGRDGYTQVIDELMRGLISSYMKQSIIYKAPWTHDSSREVYLRILRSAFLFQAAEMVNCALWKVWPCGDKSCMVDDGSHTKVLQDCLLIKKMVGRSVWYLGHARETSEDFGASENWAELMAARISHNSWGLLGLIRE